MANRTEQPLPEHSPATSTPLAPQPSRILAEPATPARCAADYAAAADVRATLDRQIRGAH